MTTPPASRGRRAAARPARRRRTSPPPTKRLLATLGMTFAGGMMVATSLPALAVTATSTEPTASVYAPVVDVLAPKVQELEVGDGVIAADVAVDEFTAVAAPPPIASSVAGFGTVEIQRTDAIVWPVTNPGRISDGFGPRSAPCAGCSTFHKGVDFIPGVGTPVMSIADGVVVTATENGGGLGVNVEVQHNIDGELLTSSYSHMQFGSLEVATGDRVTAGQQLGKIGSTGQSTGPHLHLEMYGSDGARFDGMAWLSARLG
ncbi:M23 family metallopeptidase [Agromyces mediolanus]|nr:M23 family metallopeptidase [Agromyces mediolanus]